MSLNGHSQANIAKVLGLSEKTLRRLYRAELDDAAIIINAQVALLLFKKCMAGDVTAQIFWLKCKGKWNQRAGEEADNKDDWLRAYAGEMTAYLKAKA